MTSLTALFGKARSTDGHALVNERFQAEASALIFGLGGLAGLFSMAVIHESDFYPSAVVVLAVVSLAVSLFAWRFRQRGLPSWAPLPILGPLTGCGAILITGSAAPAFALMFVWGAMYTVMFAPRQQAYIQLLAIVVLLSVMAAITGRIPLMVLLMIICTIVVQTPFIRRMVADIDNLSRTDPLTGAFNRRAFDEHLDLAMRDLSRSHPSSLLILDIDHFKHFNDEHGHIEGDRLLRDCVAAWSKELRGNDVLGRFGGEEFVVLLRNTDIAGAQPEAERLRKVTPAEVTCSIGAGELADGEKADALFRRVDAALYEAKEGGRNQVVVAPSI